MAVDFWLNVPFGLALIALARRRIDESFGQRSEPAFGVAILVAVFASAGSYASPQAFIDGFAPALGVCASLAALAGLSLPGWQLTPAVGLNPVAPAPHVSK